MNALTVHASKRAVARFLDGRAVRRTLYVLLHNMLIEAIVVFAILFCMIAARALDLMLGTNLKKGFIDKIHRVSRDELGSLRKAQVKYVFRHRYGLKRIRIELAGGTYWLSIPCIVSGLKGRDEKRYMAKIINGRSALKHRYMTSLRNLGVMVEGRDMWFDRHEGAREMAEFESVSLGDMTRNSIDAPRVLGLHKLNEDDYMLVMDFIEGVTLSHVHVDNDTLDRTFRLLKDMRDRGLVHGDIKLDNFIMSGDRVFIVDCLKIGRISRDVAHAFDLACAICALSQRTPVRLVLLHAARHFTVEELNNAGLLLGMAMAKTDIELSAETSRELRAAFKGAS